MTETVASDNSSNEMEQREAALEKFTDVLGEWSGTVSVESGATGKANVAAIIFDWENWVEDHSYNMMFDREDFDQNPVGVTGRDLGVGEDKISVTIFSTGDECSYYTDRYLDKVEEVLDYNPKANLDKVWMLDHETRPIIFEGECFDILLAPRIKPEDDRGTAFNE